MERVAEAHGARLRGPDSLSDLLLYGVDRERADELAVRFFGVETPELLPSRKEQAQSGGAPGPRWVAALTVGAVCCLVVAAVLAGVWSPGGEVASVDDTGAPLSVGADTDSGAEEAVNGPRAGDGSGEGTTIATSYPPGVGDGSLDVDTLAAAHVRAVNRSSYRLVVRQTGTDRINGDGRWQSAWQHAVVEDERTWLFSVVGTTQHADGPQLVQYTDYANGDVVYRRGDTRSGPVYDRLPAPVSSRDGGDPHAERTGQYLRRYLATSDVEVDRPTWWPEAYRVVATGRPTAIDGNVSAYTATALVNESGFVSRLTVEYVRHEAGETSQVRFRMEYAAVNETRIRPPGWLDEAQSETAMNETAG